MKAPDLRLAAILRDGAALGSRCAGESMIVSISAPVDHNCGLDPVSKKIEVICPADNDLELELTALFRCPQCTSITDDGN